VPDYYGFSSFYPDYGDTCNRYANGVIYEVDCYSGMVEDVIPLYASGYGVYNVPYDYRATYYDTPDAWYRYNNGYIYQVDPTTQLIQAVIQAIV
jgi:hypothetical protein